MYLGLKNNVPVGWSEEPVEGYIEVGQDQYDFASLNPEAVWDGTKLVLPAIEPVVFQEPKVLEITMRQARLQLATLGLYSIVNSAISSMGELAEIEWEYATTVSRENPLVQAMTGMLSWSEEQTDNYFKEGNKL